MSAATVTLPAVDAVTFEPFYLVGELSFEVLLDGRPMGEVARDGASWVAWALDGHTVGGGEHDRYGNGGDRFDSREAAAEALL